MHAAANRSRMYVKCRPQSTRSPCTDQLGRKDASEICPGIDGSWLGACVPQSNKPLLTAHVYGIRLRRCWLSSYCTQHSTTQASSHTPSPRPRPKQATQREIGTEGEETPESPAYLHHRPQAEAVRRHSLAGRRREEEVMKSDGPTTTVL